MICLAEGLARGNVVQLCRRIRRCCLSRCRRSCWTSSTILWTFEFGRREHQSRETAKRTNEPCTKWKRGLSKNNVSVRILEFWLCKVRLTKCKGVFMISLINFISSIIKQASKQRSNWPVSLSLNLTQIRGGSLKDTTNQSMNKSTENFTKIFSVYWYLRLLYSLF